MGDDSVIGILFFAAIAVFLAHRLWQVLGRRNGEAPPAPPAAANKSRPREAMPMPGLERPVPAAAQKTPLVIQPGDPMSLDTSLKQIKASDASFDERQFMTGAKAAFDLIVIAFARGDRALLRPLLADDVYRSFDRAIASRESLGDTLETSIARVTADIESVRIEDDVARITVSFRSGQSNVLRNAGGEIVDGDTRRIEDVLDIWTFARDIKSRDPNWTLAETRHQA